MGQIVRSIQGITEACKFLDYPVVSGNVSLYNETDGKAIQPTPAIGGVGLLSDYQKRCDIKFKNIDDKIFVIAGSFGNISCSIYQRDILKISNQKNPPKVNLELEKKHSEIVRELIQKGLLSSCHDISDGGLLVACYEMSTLNYGCNLTIDHIKKDYPNCNDCEILFGEDQSRYIVAVNNANLRDFLKILEKNQIKFYQIGEVISENLIIANEQISISELQKISQSVFEKNFS